MEKFQISPQMETALHCSFAQLLLIAMIIKAIEL